MRLRLPLYGQERPGRTVSASFLHHPFGASRARSKARNVLLPLASLDTFSLPTNRENSS